jgi:hypothetical protein
VEPFDDRVGSPYPVLPTVWVGCILPHMKKVITCSLLSILVNMFIFRLKKKKKNPSYEPNHVCAGKSFNILSFVYSPLTGLS